MDVISQARWILYFRGVVSLLFGIIILLNPAFSLEVLILFFGIYLLVMGFTGTFLALSQRKTKPSWYILLLEGIIALLAGIILCAWPALSMVILLWIIAIWAIIFGVAQIFNAVRYHKNFWRDAFLVIVGVIMIIFGGSIILHPELGAFVLVWFISVYSLIAGLVFLYMGFSLRSKNV